MRDFKIRVTPEESEMIQKLLFLAGYSWRGGTTDVSHLDKPYLYFEHNILTCGKSDEYFLRYNCFQISFEQFLDKIEIELNNKTISSFSNTF